MVDNYTNYLAFHILPLF